MVCVGGIADEVVGGRYDVGVVVVFFEEVM